MKIRIYFLVIIISIIAGCAMPNTTVKTIDTRPSISITGAPQGAILFVDGIDMGLAEKYDPQKTHTALRIEPGTHNIEIKSNNIVVYKQTIYAESELKNIVVH